MKIQNDFQFYLLMVLTAHVINAVMAHGGIGHPPPPPTSHTVQYAWALKSLQHLHKP